jgi:hypothetical protein
MTKEEMYMSFGMHVETEWILMSHINTCMHRENISIADLVA